MEQLFSVEKIVNDKDFSFYYKLPKLIQSLLKSLFFEDEVNKLLLLYKNDHDGKFTNQILNYLKISSNIDISEKIGNNNRYIFVCNHPTGILDGLILLNFLSKSHPTQLIINDIIDFIPNIKNLILPIEWFGTMNNDQSRKLIKALKSDKHLIVFPAGEVSKLQNFNIKDMEWNPSFIKMAFRYKRDIIPTHLSGSNSPTFYLVSMLRRLLKMDFNIEMFLLIRELFNKRNLTINVKLGCPISYKSLRREESKLEAMRIRKISYSI